MSYTHLQMVQRILESLDSDEVNSYADTVESTSVSNIVQETFKYLSPVLDLPIQHSYFKLEASGDSAKPCLMTLPDDVYNLDYLKYRNADTLGDTKYNVVGYLELEDFMEQTFSLQESRTDVETMTVTLNGDTFTFKFQNDGDPKFYTNLDDKNIVFDSYDKLVDTTLQKDKTLCYGQKVFTYTLSDTFVPPLDEGQFQLLLNEAKSQAFTELKQIENKTSDKRARKSFINTQRTKENIPSKRSAVKRTRNYGRITPN